MSYIEDDWLSTSHHYREDQIKFDLIIQRLPLEIVLIVYRVVLIQQIEAHTSITSLIGKDDTVDTLLASILTNKTINNNENVYSVGELPLWNGFNRSHFLHFTSLIKQKNIIFKQVEFKPDPTNLTLLHVIHDLKCFEKLKLNLNLAVFNKAIPLEISLLSEVSELASTEIEVHVSLNSYMTTPFVPIIWRYAFETFSYAIRSVSLRVDETFIREVGFYFLNRCKLLNSLVLTFNRHTRLSTVALNLDNDSLQHLEINSIDKDFQISLHSLSDLKEFKLTRVSDGDSLQWLLLNGLPDSIETLLFDDCKFDNHSYLLPLGLKRMMITSCELLPNFTNLGSLQTLNSLDLEINGKLGTKFFKSLPHSLAHLKLNAREQFSFRSSEELSDFTHNNFTYPADILDLSVIPENLQQLQFTYLRGMAGDSYNYNLMTFIMNFKTYRPTTAYNNSNKLLLHYNDLSSMMPMLTLDFNWFDFNILTSVSIAQHDFCNFNIQLDNVPYSLDAFDIDEGMERYSTVISVPRPTENLKRLGLEKYMVSGCGNSGKGSCGMLKSVSECCVVREIELF